jgi:aspartyl-tRNA(Asn)/glutamyl-tRNA(Gln) amidotransferase subunit A
MTEATPLDRPIADLARAVASGEVSALSVAEETLERARKASDLNALLTLSDRATLETARALDARRKRGEALGKLAGVPVAIKDALCTKDAPTTAGSKILTRRGPDGRAGGPESGFRPPYDATPVERLRAAGALLFGKTNMDEFAMGSSGENSAFGPAKHPLDPRYAPGGSSSGSAVAVAARLCPAALGSDTGGSIRQPAAFCGVVGVKPSYGRVSRYGLIAFASSLDQVGPFARDVRSAALVLEVIAGEDAHDSTCAKVPVGDYVGACERDVRPLRVGVPEEYFAEGLDSEIAEAVRHAIDTLAREGCSIRPVKLPHTRYGVATYYIVATAEASSNLARFDGVRFGLRIEPEHGDLRAMYGATRDAGFGVEVKRRILLGTYVLSAGYYDAYYRRAQRARTLIRRDFDQAFSDVDVIAAPTSPTPAFRLGEKVDDPLAMYLADVYTLPASLAGIAGITVPCGTTRATPARPALPIGLQLLGPAFAEENLFTAAAAVERLVQA